MKPLAVDLYAGLGGWAEGFLAEGYDIIGFDIERHEYGDHRYPGLLVIQDVCTLHGSQFKNAALIVASPPCQEYSYMAMPWTRAKAKAKAIREDTTGEKLAALNRLFNECFRIQREASFAAGRHIPLVVENVKGAQPWVGRARFNFGSFYLWGDVPALMPITSRTRMKSQISCAPRRFEDRIASTPEEAHALHYRLPDGIKVPNFRFDGSSRSFQSASVAETGIKAPGMNWSDRTKRGQDFTRLAGNEAIKNNGGSSFNIGSPGQKVTNKNPVHALTGIKGSEGYERDHPDAFGWKKPSTSSRSPKKKMASAMIAKIPLPLSRHIAATFK